MKYICDIDIDQSCPSAVALGNFDGVHLGHRALITTLIQEAEKNSLQSVVFSFSPHPSFILSGKEPVDLILTNLEKSRRMEEMGVDTLIDYPFTKEFAVKESLRFIEDILLSKLKAKVVIVGEDFRFGKKRSATAQDLKKFGEELGFTVIIVKPVKWNNEIVSSTKIRNLIKQGNMQEANELLGTPFSIIETVVEGKKIGRQIGIPTINFITNTEKLLPLDGVYASQTVWKGKIFNSVTSIGKNPTVNGNQKTVETYILDFNNNVYGEVMEVKLLQWLRKEERFDSIDELKEQINQDIHTAQSFFVS